MIHHYTQFIYPTFLKPQSSIECPRGCKVTIIESIKPQTLNHQKAVVMNCHIWLVAFCAVCLGAFYVVHQLLTVSCAFA